MSPADILARLPTLLVSSRYLARVAGDAPIGVGESALYVARALPEGAAVPALAGSVLCVTGAEDLPLLRLPAAMAGDAEARAALCCLQAPHCDALPDAGRPEVLWHLAERFGLIEWWAEPTEAAGAAAVLGRLAGLLGAGRPRPELAPLRAAFEVAAALAAGGHADGDEALAKATQRALLWPRPALGAGGMPAALGKAGAAALPKRSGEVFLLAAELLAASRLPGLRPAPQARPLLLAPVPPSSDEREGEALARYAALAAPLPLLPAPDPVVLERRLVAEFPWMASAIAALARELALRSLGDGACRLPPLLLLGPPGIGKTRLCRILAEACGLPWRRLAVADAAAITTLTGNGRGWRGGRPCWAAASIAETGVMNPMLVIDDLDRAATDDRHGTPATFLLSQLEPEGNRNFMDTFLLAPVDLSQVNWALTANSLAGLPGALLDRVLLVEADLPKDGALDVLLQGVRADIAAEAGLPGPEALPTLPHAVEDALRAAFVDGRATARLLARALRQAFGAALLGTDPLGPLREVLNAAGGRDDRPYGGGGRRMGFQARSSGGGP